VHTKVPGTAGVWTAAGMPSCTTELGRTTATELTSAPYAVASDDGAPPSLADGLCSRRAQGNAIGAVEKDQRNTGVIVPNAPAEPAAEPGIVPPLATTAFTLAARCSTTEPSTADVTANTSFQANLVRAALSPMALVEGSTAGCDDVAAEVIVENAVNNDGVLRIASASCR
jgi:hypothetical protein